MTLATTGTAMTLEERARVAYSVQQDSNRRQSDEQYVRELERLLSGCQDTVQNVLGIDLTPDDLRQGTPNERADWLDVLIEGRPWRFRSRIIDYRLTQSLYISGTCESVHDGRTHDLVWHEIYSLTELGRFFEEEWTRPCFQCSDRAETDRENASLRQVVSTADRLLEALNDFVLEHAPVRD